MKNDRETGKSLDTLFQNVETKRRGNKDTVSVSGTLSCGELVCAVRSSDCDRKRVTSGSVYELFYFFGSGISFLTGLNYYFVFDTCKSTKLCFYNYAVSVSVLNYLLGKSDVVFE